jgi:hypothetical protein
MYIHHISITIHILLSTPLPFPGQAGCPPFSRSVTVVPTVFYLKTAKSLIFAFFEVHDNP